MIRVPMSLTFWAGLFLVFGYWPLTFLLPTMQQNEWLQAIRVVIGFAVVSAYAPGAWRAIRSNQPTYAQQLASGIVVNAVGSAGQALWLVLWRLAEQPLWMINSDLNGWFIWLQIVGWGLHITAPGAIDGEIPKTNVVRLGVAFGAGLVLGGIVVAYHPDLSGVLGEPKR